MECKAATLSFAQEWASKLPFSCPEKICLVFSVGSLDKSYVLIDALQFSASGCLFIVCNYDAKEQKATVLGGTTVKPHGRPGSTRLLVSRRSLRPVPLAVKRRPQLKADSEVTLPQVAEALRDRFKALQNPSVVALSADADLLSHRVAAIAAECAPSSADRSHRIERWLRAERHLAEIQMPQHTVLDVLGPGTVVHTANKADGFKFPPGVHETVEALAEPGSVWAGPVPFERVSRQLMKSHTVVLRLGQAWVPLHGVRPWIAAQHANRLRPKGNSPPPPAWPRSMDPRLRSLCRLWWDTLLAGNGEAAPTKPLSLDKLPACLKRLLHEQYPTHDNRRITINILRRLGHTDATALAVKAWQRQVETKHGSQAPIKLKEIEREAEAYSKSFNRASYNCGALQVRSLCPHFNFPANTPTAALKACFGCGGVPDVPSPVTFVQQRNKN